MGDKYEFSQGRRWDVQSATCQKDPSEVCIYSHIVSKRDDDKLSVASALLDIVCDDRDIPEIQCCIDFIHEIQRSWLEDMESEDESE